MNDAILLLASSNEGEEELLFAEQAVKTVMRKFRQSVRFDHITRTIVNECDHSELAKRIVSEEIAKHDAILWGLCRKNESRDKGYLQKNMGVFVYEHYVAGRCIISPAYERWSKTDELGAVNTVCLSESKAKEVCMLALSLAQKRKRHLTVCADNSNSAIDILQKSAFEGEAAKVRRLEIEYLSADEIIWKHLQSNPFTDVILSNESLSRFFVLQLCASMRSPGGYICMKSAQKRIYCREVIPFEEYGNGRFARTVLAAAAVVENELGRKSPAEWMRRAVGIADERCGNASKEEYCAELIRAINERIRNRRKTNE